MYCLNYLRDCVSHVLFELGVSRSTDCLIEAIYRSRETIYRGLWKKTITTSLKTSVLKFCGTELAGCGGLLFQHLLFMGVRVADLYDMLLSTWLANSSIIELLNNFFTYFTGFKAGKVSIGWESRSEQRFTVRSLHRGHFLGHHEEYELSRLCMA